MSETYFPFNSINGDRKFKTEDWTNYFSKTLTTGVFPKPAAGLKVMSNNNMTLTVNAGSANIEGYFYTLFSNKVITLETAGASNRTDLVVLRWSKVNRSISIEILKNSTNRIWNDDIKDLLLAKVTVKALTASVIDADIADTRLSENCGIVNSLMQADTEKVFQQYESWFNTNKAYYDTNISNWTATKQSEFENWTGDKQNEFTSWSEGEKEKFIAWLEDMKNILDDEAVGNILNRINSNTEKIEQNTEQLLTLEQEVNKDLVTIKENIKEKIDEIEEKINSSEDLIKCGGNYFEIIVEPNKTPVLGQIKIYDDNSPVLYRINNELKLYVNGTFSSAIHTINLVEKHTNNVIETKEIKSSGTMLTYSKIFDNDFETNNYKIEVKYRSTNFPTYDYSKNVRTIIDKTNINKPRTNAGKAVVNDKIYYIDGYEGNTSVSENDCYDTLTDTWTSKSKNSVARGGLGVAAIGDNIYCIGGSYTNNYKMNECYNATTNTWTNRTQMPTGRGGLSATAIGDSIYCIGGNSSSTYYTTNECYNATTNTWTRREDMTKTVIPHSATYLDGKIYIIGYYTNIAYDVNNNSWATYSQAGSYSYPSTCILNNHIYAFNRVSSNYEASKYNPKTDSWSTIPSFPLSGAINEVVTVKDKIYILGQTSHRCYFE